MKVRKALKVLGKIILSVFLLGILFFTFTIGQFLIPGAYQVMHPMHTAVRTNSPKAVYALSYLGFKHASAKGLKGGCTTPLGLAVQLGSRQIVDILLDRGAPLKGCGKNSRPYNIVAASAANPDLLSHLITQRKFDPMMLSGPEDEYPIFSGIMCPYKKQDTGEPRDNTRSLKIFLDNGVDPNIKSIGKRYNQQYGEPMPLLAVAAFSKCQEPVKFLLENGADPIAAEQSLKEFYHHRKSSTSEGVYQFEFQSFYSDEIRENIRLIKRAAGK